MFGQGAQPAECTPVKPKLGAQWNLQPGGDLPVLEAGQDMARDDGAFPVRERAQQPQQLALYFVEKRLDRKRSIYNKLA